MPQLPPWMLVKQAALRLGVHRTTIWKLVKRRKLRRIWLTDRRPAITVDSITRYEAELELKNQAEGWGGLLHGTA